MISDKARYTVYCAVISTGIFCKLFNMDNVREIKVRLKEFGGNLRRARVARKVTQEVLSEKADLNIRTLQKIEAGQTNILITTAIRLKESLDCSWLELLP